MIAPCVTLTTDFGLADPYVAEMKARLLTEWARFPGGLPQPHPAIVDLSHAVPPGDIAAGCWLLRRSCRRFPAGSVHLAVVDPGVGSDRPAIAAMSGGQVFVGPGNGLFAFLASSADLEVYVLDSPLYHRGDPGPAPTFHGRDIFAVAAAHLAFGAPAAQVGRRVGADRLGADPLDITPPAGGLGRVVWIDRFGNAVTDLERDGSIGRELSAGAVVSIGGVLARGPFATFAAGPAGELFWYWGSGGTLEAGLRDGSAADVFGILNGQAVLSASAADADSASDKENR